MAGQEESSGPRSSKLERGARLSAAATGAGATREGEAMVDRSGVSGITKACASSSAEDCGRASRRLCRRDSGRLARRYRAACRMIRLSCVAEEMSVASSTPPLISFVESGAFESRSTSTACRLRGEARALPLPTVLWFPWRRLGRRDEQVAEFVYGAADDVYCSFRCVSQSAKCAVANPPMAESGPELLDFLGGVTRGRGGKEGPLDREDEAVAELRSTAEVCDPMDPSCACRGVWLSCIDVPCW